MPNPANQPLESNQKSTREMPSGSRGAMRGSTLGDRMRDRMSESDNLREQSGRVFDRISERAREFSANAPEKARHYYDTSVDWVRNNYRNRYFIAGAVGFLALIGFLVVRGRRSAVEYESYEI